MAEPSTLEQVTSPADFGDGSAGEARRWISELERSEEAKVEYLERCKKIAELYSRSRRPELLATAAKRQYSLLWANVETLKPAIYARVPTPVVGRRFKDADPVGRVASEVLERALSFSLEVRDFAGMMKAVRDEFILMAGGQAFVRYVPTMEQVKVPAPEGEGAPAVEPVAPDGQVTDSTDVYDRVSWEDVEFDHVHRADWGTNPARSWPEVRMVWRRAFLTRQQCQARFKAASNVPSKTLGDIVPLDWGDKGRQDPNTEDQFAKAAIYEIWDKDTKTVFWVSRSYSTAVLDKREDPLELQDFFPCPKPLLGTTDTESLIPVPDYVFYQDQADEINDLTARIGRLIDALKVRGLYAASGKTEIDQLLKADDNALIPVEDWNALSDKGGIEKMIAWLPLEAIVQAIKACIETRKQLLDDVFQITGIADIMRGDTDPNETLGAQKLKQNWGSSRVRDKQNEMQRFARDLLRLGAEIIAKRFDQKTLAEMTDTHLMTRAEKEQVQQVMQLQAQAQQQQQQAAQAAQQPPQPGLAAPPAPPPAAPPTPIPPDVQKMMGLPAWEDVMDLLRNNAARTFRIDVETDSTIEPNDQEEKQRRVEFVTAVGKYLAESLPVVQAAPQMLPVIIEGLMFLVRGFRVGREMEDTIDRALDDLQQAAAQPKPSQQDPVAQAKAQAAQMTGQAAMVRAQSAVQVAQIQAQAENTRTQTDAALAAHQQRLEMAAHGLAASDQAHQHVMDQHELALQAVQQAEQRELRREVMDHTPAKVNTP